MAQPKPIPADIICCVCLSAPGTVLQHATYQHLNGWLLLPFCDTDRDKTKLAIPLTVIP